MGTVLELEESDWAGYIPDSAVYPATVVSVGIKEMPWKDKDTGDIVRRVEFKFRLISDDAHDGVEIWGSTPVNFVDNENCKLKNWAEALLGRRLEPKYRLDLDTLVGQRCLVVIEKQTYEKDGREKFRNRVREVNPTRQNKEALIAAGRHQDEEF
jgi:hypothetical protein